MEHASVFLEQLAPPSQPDLEEPGFWHDFLVGMLKPLAATALVAMAVALSFTRRLGIEGEMLYAIAHSFVQLSSFGSCSSSSSPRRTLRHGSSSRICSW
ncbi:unnamed protein product [Urochloa humidicola]